MVNLDLMPLYRLRCRGLTLFDWKLWCGLFRRGGLFEEIIQCIEDRATAATTYLTSSGFQLGQVKAKGRLTLGALG
jgi:hypothetical protein